MAKSSGGTRNYAGKNTLSKRREEFDSLMGTGKYDNDRSFFDNSGGFVVTHKHHNNDKDNDMSSAAVAALSKKGYKVYLGDERNYVAGIPTPDGRLYKHTMEIKTVNTAGNNTIKKSLEASTKQGASVVVLYQNTNQMTREYVESQIKLFNEKSPKMTQEKLKHVIVVGKSGNVHRHKIK